MLLHLCQPLYKTSWYHLATKGMRLALSNQNCAVVSPFVAIFTNQSCSIKTNQNVQLQPIRTVLYGFLICIKMDHIFFLSSGNFISKRRLPLCLCRMYFFHWRLHFPSFQIVHLNSFSSFCTPDWGLLSTLAWWQQTFVDNNYLKRTWGELEFLLNTFYKHPEILDLLLLNLMPRLV